MNYIQNMNRCVGPVSWDIDRPKNPPMRVGGRYNWKNQSERLVYLGYNHSGNGYWHQFAKVESLGVVWCEVTPSDLHMIEETKEIK